MYFIITSSSFLNGSTMSLYLDLYSSSEHVLFYGCLYSTPIMLFFLLLWTTSMSTTEFEYPRISFESGSQAESMYTPPFLYVYPILPIDLLSGLSFLYTIGQETEIFHCALFLFASLLFLVVDLWLLSWHYFFRASSLSLVSLPLSSFVVLLLFILLTLLSVFPFLFCSEGSLGWFILFESLCPPHAFLVHQFSHPAIINISVGTGYPYFAFCILKPSLQRFRLLDICSCCQKF